MPLIVVKKFKGTDLIRKDKKGNVLPIEESAFHDCAINTDHVTHVDQSPHPGVLTVRYTNDTRDHVMGSLEDFAPAPKWTEALDSKAAEPTGKPGSSLSDPPAPPKSGK